MFNETYRKLLEDLSQKSQLFQSVAILLRNVSEVVNAAQNTNELNQQTLRQASVSWKIFFFKLEWQFPTWISFAFAASLYSRPVLLF